MQQSCTKGVKEVADVAIDFQIVAMNVKFGIVGIVCWVVCSFDGGDALFVEGIGAEDDKRRIGVVVIHVSQGAPFTIAIGILSLHQNISKQVIAGPRVWRCI